MPNAIDQTGELGYESKKSEIPAAELTPSDHATVEVEP